MILIIAFYRYLSRSVKDLKYSVLRGNSNPDLCDSGAISHKLSCQLPTASWSIIYVGRLQAWPFPEFSGLSLWWPKRVNHKSVYQNTKQFPKTQIDFSKHKSISQNTNEFAKTQTNCSKHKPISRNTNQWTGLLFFNYQIGPGKDSFPGFSASNMATSVML